MSLTKFAEPKDRTFERVAFEKRVRTERLGSPTGKLDLSTSAQEIDKRSMVTVVGALDNVERRLFDQTEVMFSAIFFSVSVRSAVERWVSESHN